jgi:hypothetical protein
MTGPSARRAKTDAPAKLGQLTSDTLRPRIGNKTATATAVAALIAISALIAPAEAFATPTPLTAPGCSIDATNTAASSKYHRGCECKCYDTSSSKYHSDCDCDCYDD